MADLFSNSTSETSKFESVTLVTKLGLISIGIITTLILFKVAIIPFSSNLISTLPGLYISLHGWLSRPYIFILLNFIILCIALSYISTNGNTKNNHSHPISSSVARNKQSTNLQEHTWQLEVTQEEEQEEEVKEVISSVNLANSNYPSQVFASISTSPSLECSKEVKEVEEDQKDMSTQESLDETWKLIMEGKNESSTRQLKKSETWNTPPKVLDRASGQFGELEEDEELDPVAWAKRELRKSETFNDSVSLRRDMSMSPDELTQRVEEFINKFNQEMRLQRQESERRCRELVNRGVYV